MDEYDKLAEKTDNRMCEIDAELVANEATIYLKTALICEAEGIEKAMEYFKGFHSEDEYKDFLPGGLMGDPLEK